MIAVDLALGVSLYSGLRKGLDMPHQLAAGIAAEYVLTLRLSKIT